MKTYYTCYAVLLSLQLAYTQGTAINDTGTAPDSSAILDISSSTKGLLIPRMTTDERLAIASPATGLMVFDMDETTFYCYAGSWVEIMSGFVTLMRDADDDTKIQVEESTDEDVIRFDLEGMERWVMTENRLEPSGTGGSVFIGEDSGSQDDSSDNGNVAIGRGTLTLTANRDGLVAVGDSALFNNGNGASFDNDASYNTAIGSKAMRNNTIGFWNTAVGHKALFKNTTGQSNSAIGIVSLYSNTTGSYNTAAGQISLYQNVNGHYNTANGYAAMYSNTAGSGNVAYGTLSLESNIIGNNNCAIGYSALSGNSTGHSNTAIGPFALKNGSSRSYNVAVGDSALYSNGTSIPQSYSATGNTAVGSKTLQNNTSGYYNSAYGHRSLYSNSIGHSNIGTGYQSLYFNTTGTSNVAIGAHALYVNTTKSGLVAVGDSALYNNGISSTQSFHATGNTAVGKNALMANNNGYANTALGLNAMKNNSIGYKNTAIGNDALSKSVDGQFNVAIGSSALSNSISGSNNVSVGVNALGNMTTGFENVAIGSSADFNNQGGLFNTMIGYDAGKGSSLHSKNGNIFIGYQAGYNESGSNKLYIENSASITPLIYGEFDAEKVRIHGKLSVKDGLTDFNGDTKIHVEETFDENKIRFDMGGTEYFVLDGPRLLINNSGSSVFIGDGAGQNDDLTNNNITAVGKSALQANSSGIDNCAIGSQALELNSAGNYNTAVGRLALQANNASNNTAIGREALTDNTTGDYNLAIGNAALQYNLTGDRNVAIGHVALRDATGMQNVAIGVDAGRENTGDKNVFIGFQAGKVNSGSNNIFIGTEAGENSTLSDRLFIDNTNTATPLLYGEFLDNELTIHGELGINKFDPAHPIHLSSGAHCTAAGVWTNASDISHKDHITDLPYGLKEIITMRPKSYDYRTDGSHSIGFIAQDMEQIIPQVVSGEEGDKGIAYGLLTAVLVKALQEQQAMIESLTARIAVLEGQ